MTAVDTAPNEYMGTRLLRREDAPLLTGEAKFTDDLPIPGVQKPHWRPCWSQNACCNGCSVAPSAMPSMVLISEPDAWTASMVHDFALRPSTWTVHAPQLLVSQPTCVPVSPNSSRSRWTRRRRGSTSASIGAPLTVRETCCVVMAPTR